jgi:hypothetical protein
MRVLFDQATPVPIRPHLKGHEVRTTAQQGWDRLKNGELLVAAETDGFDVLLTTDKNMRYQQNLAGRKIAVVVLGRQQWPSLRPHVRLVVEAVQCRLTWKLHRNPPAARAENRPSRTPKLTSPFDF